MRFNARSLLSLARSAARLLASPPPATAPRRPAPGAASGAASNTGGFGAYPGDHRGPVRPVYSPHPDGAPDPGEVVWTWVPYEEDPQRGKDRPVLLIGRSGGCLLALMMTTRDRNNAQRTDPAYVDVGSGAWDRQGRPSEVRVDRVLRIRPEDIRRIGAVLPEDRFDRVARALRDGGGHG